MRTAVCSVVLLLALGACSDPPRPAPGPSSASPTVIGGETSARAPELGRAAAADVARAARTEDLPAARLAARTAVASDFAQLVDSFARDYPQSFTAGGLVRDDREQPWVAFTTAPPPTVTDQLAALPTDTLLITDAPVTALEAQAAALVTVTQLADGTSSAKAHLDDASFGLAVTYTGGDPAEVSARTAALTEAARAVAPGLPEVTLTQVRGEPLQVQTTVKGGRPLFRNGTAVCTAGFTARRNGNLGVISARHCPRALRYNNRPRVIKAGANATGTVNGQIDLRFYRTRNPNRTAAVFRATGTGNRGDRVVRGVGDPVVGQVVCTWGRYSRYGCSVVTTVNMCASFEDGRIRCGLAQTNTRISTNGDSGGPWFTGNTARGITTGADATTSVFTQISRVRSGLGARILRK